MHSGILKKAVFESMPNIRHSGAKLAEEITSYSQIIYIHWCVLNCTVLTGCITCATIFVEEFQFWNVYPFNLLCLSSEIQWLLATVVYLIPAIVFWYSSMLPVTIGIYLVFHEWIQFRMLNNYLRDHLWQRQNSNALFNNKQQEIIYMKIRKAVKWHLHLKRYEICVKYLFVIVKGVL